MFIWTLKSYVALLNNGNEMTVVDFKENPIAELVG